MDAETQLAENFCCVKCHNRQAVARTAAISGRAAASSPRPKRRAAFPSCLIAFATAGRRS